jgi:pimeloyl-ACP methyl ester carboxylesterase
MNPPKQQRGFIGTSLGQLHYRKCGEGPAFVLMQTLPFSTAMFNNLMPVLGRHFTCYAIDLLGFSYSDRRPKSLSVEENADLLAEAMDGLGIETACLLGGHFTGSVAVEFAISRPERARRLALDGIAAIPKEDYPMLAERFPPAALTPSAQHVAGRWEYAISLMRRLDPEMTINTRNLQVMMERAYSFMFFNLGGPGGETGGAYPLAEKLPQLKVPTMAIASPTDTLWPWRERTFALLPPHARRHVFDTINPLYQFDRADRAPEYAALLMDFIGSAGA